MRTKIESNLDTCVKVLENGGHEPVFQTEFGYLYQGDCLPWLKGIPDESIHTVFADPPFNLGKSYGKNISDQMKDEEYLEWSNAWLEECIRVLVPGGALFVFNLPKWLIPYGAYLNTRGMSFRHWIACRMPKAYPRGKKMAPAHYGMLYYCKGMPRAFNKVYVPIQVCRHCGGEIRDYGGHRKRLNPKGINLMDVFDAPEEVWEDVVQPVVNGWTEADEIWDDIPPVRHGKYKVRKLKRNELAPIMLERIIAMSTNADEIVMDPFGGSGTTYYAAEKLGRRWFGIELGDVTPIVQRLVDFQKGEDVGWESARGNGNGGKKRSKARSQQELALPPSGG